MRSRSLLVTILLTAISFTSFAQDMTSVRKKQFNLEDQLGVQGYDPVAYFKLNKAVKGKKENAFTYQGITYYFSTPQFRDEFVNNPSAYEPQYGGWCAYAMGAKGEKVEIDPKTFKVLNGKLYLFYHSYFNNTLTSWNKDESNLKTKADVSWQRIYH